MRDCNPSDYKLSCLTDYEPRHWEFSRNSGIPYGYFDRSRTRVWRAAEIVMSVLCVVALATFIFLSGTQ